MCLSNSYSPLRKSSIHRFPIRKSSMILKIQKRRFHSPSDFSAWRSFKPELVLIEDECILDEAANSSKQAAIGQKSDGSAVGRSNRGVRKFLRAREAEKDINSTKTLRCTTFSVSIHGGSDFVDKLPILLRTALQKKIDE